MTISVIIPTYNEEDVILDCLASLEKQTLQNLPASKAGFEVIVVDERWKKSQRVWIARNKEGIYAVVAVCTHLGCTPNWFPAEVRFKCPCHGSNYNLEGDVVGGPAPRPLWRLGLGLAPDGQLLVDKSIKEDRAGLREKGQFLLPL